MKRLAALLFLSAPACVADPTLDRDSAYVIGGGVTAAGEFPGVGGLVYDFGGGPEFSCTATLIAPDAVLTAAHCLEPDFFGDEVPGFTLALDTTVPGFEVIPGRAKFPHEQFDINAPINEGLAEFFDIGVVLLERPITTVAPVPMPRPGQAAQIVAGLDLEIVGYGRTSNQSFDVGVMFDATTSLISLNPTEIQVGMGAPQPQNCNGDSGGPGFADLGDGARRVIGVVSRSFSGGECNMGGVDTRVDAYLTWIHGKVASGIPCDSGLSPACEENGEESDDGGCCAAGGDSKGSLLLAFLVGLTVLARRRRAPV
jgi:hypothetical protein